MGLLTDYYGHLGKLVAAPEPRVPTRDSQNALGRKQFDPNQASIAEAILGLSPILGDVLSAKDTAASLSEGNYGEAALNGVGLLPFVPGLAGKIVQKSPYPISMNPVKAEAEHILGRSRFNDVRGIKDPKTGDVFIADANMTTHKDLAEAMGIDWYDLLDAGASHRFISKNADDPRLYGR